MKKKIYILKYGIQDVGEQKQHLYELLVSIGNTLFHVASSPTIAELKEEAEKSGVILGAKLLERAAMKVSRSYYCEVWAKKLKESDRLAKFLIG